MKNQPTIFKSSSNIYWAVWPDGRSIRKLDLGGGYEWSEDSVRYLNISSMAYERHFPAETKLSAADKNALLREHPIPCVGHPPSPRPTDTQRLNWIIRKCFFSHNSRTLCNRRDIDKAMKRESNGRKASPVKMSLDGGQ